MKSFFSFAAGAALVFLLVQFTDLVDRDHSHADQAAGFAERTGLSFSRSELDSLAPDLEDFRKGYDSLRKNAFPNALPNPLVFTPAEVLPVTVEKSIVSVPEVVVKADDPNLPFLSVHELSTLIRTRQLTSVELTKKYIERIKKYDDSLHAVVTLMEESALTAAENADREIASGKYRGPLHGIPYGLKDLFSVKGTKTTWGSVPYKDQTIDETATIVTKLDEAGAILLAKLTLGELAWGDVWFGGKTRNPWNTKRGSSGSSAGSASATSAGLVAFAIGTETWGSIVSPASECGVSGLRPSFGTVSRAGGMVLSWSMDKPGPITRSVNDLALVFNAIRGQDAGDLATRNIAFSYAPESNAKPKRIGYAKSLFERSYADSARDAAVLNVYREAGFELVPLEFPAVSSGMDIILSAEAGAAFDELTRSNGDDRMVRQIRNAWPNVFRASRFIPAVEYIQANRLRPELIRKTEALFESVDAIVTPSFGGDVLLLANLTGHPCVVVPNGFDARGLPNSISFIGKLYGDGRLLEIAALYQQKTAHHRTYPGNFVN